MMNELQLYFKYRCEKGLKKRGLAGRAEYKKRLDYEIRIIEVMDFPGYFLIVSDIVTWAKDNGISVGPGRGSAAGSLVAYALEITHLDPIKYGLVFERFLNPSRVSYPDIDLDFDETQRDRVIEYLQEKYGEDKVAHIGTYGSMKAKGAIRDVARALGFPYEVGDKLSKLVLPPIAGHTQTLATCYEKVPELKSIRNSPGTIEHEVLVWAERMENRLRSFGTHASGVVISNLPIHTRIPLSIGKDGKPTTQFEMNTVEEVGLIKFDFLGLRALTTIDRCVKSVLERHGITIDPLEISISDKPTYLMLQKGKLDGVFQLEGSTGIRDLTVQIKPHCLEDISAIAALYRPGPLGSGMVQQVIKVRNGYCAPDYLVSELESVLKETAGVIVYQEQAMQICRELAGYTMAEADNMRKIIGKKLPEKMKQERGKFIGGMQEKEIDNAEELFSQIEEFALYSFNKAHSICYAYIAYQMAYLKTHYPLEFMCACLVSDQDETEKVIKYINHCKHLELQVLPPDANESMTSFAIASDGESIRFGLAAVKHLGEVPAGSIIEERQTHGPYESIVSFAGRIDLGQINKRKLESLVLAGAFDSTGDHSRSSLMAVTQDIYEYKQEHKKYVSKTDTFNKRTVKYDQRLLEIEQGSKKKPLKVPVEPEPPTLPSIEPQPEMPIEEVLAYEKELMGYYISGHPLDNIKEIAPYKIEEIKEEGRDKDTATLIGIPSAIKEITTKKRKQKMAYMVLEDKSGTIEAVILPKPYSMYKHLLSDKHPARFRIQIDVLEGDEAKIVKAKIKSIQMLESVRESLTSELELVVPMKIATSAASTISSLRGNQFRVNLSVSSKEDNVWRIGTFKCDGDRSALLKKIQEL